MASKSVSMADLLRWFGLVSSRVVWLKDGCLMGGFEVTGLDLDTASEEQKALLARVVNNAFAHLEDGWMVHIQALRTPTAAYPTGAFTEKVTRLIDDERRAWYMSEGNAYESRTMVFLTHQPPALRRSQKTKGSDDLDPLLRDDAISTFERSLLAFGRSLSLAFHCTSLENASMLAALALCLNGSKAAQAEHCPKTPCDIDAILARDLIVGDPLIYDDQYIGVLSVIGTPDETWPAMLADLQHLPYEYRWSIRYIPMGYNAASTYIKGCYGRWSQARQSLLASISRSHNATQNLHSTGQALDAQEAEGTLNAGGVGFGHVTTTIIVRAETPAGLEEALAAVQGVLIRLSFGTLVEHRNAADAFFGSLPGHGAENIRKPVYHSMNVAHMMPLGSPWTGLTYDPCPFLPAKSPSLIRAGTAGRNPFKLPLHVGDVGHALVLGPTGMGKSTLLATMTAQFDRYPDSQIFIFDKGRSLYPLVSAMKKGIYYTLGADDSPALCPLAELESGADQTWAAEYIEALVTLSGVTVTPRQRSLIQEAIGILARTTKLPSERTLYDFYVDVQDEDLKIALEPYRAGGLYGRYLGGDSSDISYSDVTAFELEDLLRLGERVVTPTLLYLFQQIEKRLTGRPTLIVLDEAWLLLDTPLFATRIKEWLKVLRKKNASCVLATQELSDIARSTIGPAIVDSCPTKILLPNPAMAGEEAQLIYSRMLQLTKPEMELIASAMPKRDYYYTSPLGRRLFSLDLQPATLAFVGAAGLDDLKAVSALQKTHGHQWPEFWLAERVGDEAAAYWRSLEV